MPWQITSLTELQREKQTEISKNAPKNKIYENGTKISAYVQQDLGKKW